MPGTARRTRVLVDPTGQTGRSVVTVFTVQEKCTNQGRHAGRHAPGEWLSPATVDLTGKGRTEPRGILVPYARGAARDGKRGFAIRGSEATRAVTTRHNPRLPPWRCGDTGGGGDATALTCACVVLGVVVRLPLPLSVDLVALVAWGYGSTATDS